MDGHRADGLRASAERGGATGGDEMRVATLFVTMMMMGFAGSARSDESGRIDWDDPKPAAERTAEGFRAAERARVENAEPTPASSAPRIHLARRHAMR